MFYYLSEYTDLFSPLRVFQYTTFRAVFAAHHGDVDLRPVGTVAHPTPASS